MTVTGFIAPAGEGYTDGYTIARMVISCCAADANPMQLHVAGDAPFPANTWVHAVVTVDADTATLDNGYVPTVAVTLDDAGGAAGRPVRALTIRRCAVIHSAHRRPTNQSRMSSNVRSHAAADMREVVGLVLGVGQR